MGIDLLMREEYGVLSNDRFYKKAVKCFKVAFKNIFTNSIILEDICCDFPHRGYFKIIYRYLPSNYSIIVENEMMRFNIRIKDEEGANNFLYGIEKHDTTLEYKNIKSAVFLLKRVLAEDKFVMYLYKDKKLYEKKGNKLKRVKDLRSL